MADIPTTRAIAWGWIEYPWPLPSGTHPNTSMAATTRQKRRELRDLVRAELTIAGFQTIGPVGGNFLLTGADPVTGNRIEFDGGFVEMCKFASNYLTERGNDDG